MIEADGWETVYATPPIHLRPCPVCLRPVGAFGVLANNEVCFHLHAPLNLNTPRLSLATWDSITPK